MQFNGRWSLLALVLIACQALADDKETLPSLRNQQPPQTLAEMWAGFDPRAEPLELEVLKQWEQDDVVMRVVRFRIGVFKGKKTTLAAIYGFPKSSRRDRAKIPGLVQIHGGGQYADHRACLLNAKRGYATISIAWAGRISAPGYSVSPAEVKLFWDRKVDDPNYKLTTDWGLVDGYHAPGRNPGNQFPEIRAASWTLDPVDSPRNSGWFLCALAARRAITFLEQQPEVDPQRLGVYGHSMGGKLSVLAAVDSRVKAAAPSCGGISDRDNRRPIYQKTLGDNVSLENISCPILFLSPANDFHGRIDDLPSALTEIASKDWRVTCSPHHNHQDTPPYEVTTLLWMDQHLKDSFTFPQTPKTKLQLKTGNGQPLLSVSPDTSRPILSVDVFYTQDGKKDGGPLDRQNVMSRFWHHAESDQTNNVWTADLPLANTEKPLWVYANVVYALQQPLQGAGYYYQPYQAESYNLSSVLTMVEPNQLKAAGVQKGLATSPIIEDFANDWAKEWFTYRPSDWARTRFKIGHQAWQAPLGARLSLDVQSAQPNRMVILLDGYAAEVDLAGGPQWQSVDLKPADFKDYHRLPRSDWKSIRQLKITPTEHLRPPRGVKTAPRRVGRIWKGSPPQFRNLHWKQSHCFLDFPRATVAEKDYDWTTDHMQLGVRWQPFAGRPQNNAYDSKRPVIANDSSYVQMWASWRAMEPTPAHQNYQLHPSASLQAIERAVDFCNTNGLKVELVFFHCPAWASESGKAGGFKPRGDLFQGYVGRMAAYFKGRVHAYQLSHEANLQGLMEGADIDFIINKILLDGGRTIRAIYDAEPAIPVLISTTGMSPCEPCPATKGLSGRGGRAVGHFYDLMIGNPDLMQTVDALNLNVSDHANGYGRIDDSIATVWDQYQLVRSKLDAEGHRAISVLSAESWIVWDKAGNAHDVNGDGLKNEKDAYQKAVTILGECLQRGLNSINLPWSDNSSAWAMGLTKRRDYNGRIKKIRPAIVVPANDGGADIVTQKVSLRGREDQFEILDGSGRVFTVEDYDNPSDPNHLHYYIWKWYAQIAGGSDEVIRHAIAGEAGNDILVSGPAFNGEQRYKISSWNRSREHFTVLIYCSGADGTRSATVSVPAKIQTGEVYNNDDSAVDFRGEGMSDGDAYFSNVITKDISLYDGSDTNPICFASATANVRGQMLEVLIPKMNKFTAIEFIKGEKSSVD